MEGPFFASIFCRVYTVFEVYVMFLTVWMWILVAVIPERGVWVEYSEVPSVRAARGAWWMTIYFMCAYWLNLAVMGAELLTMRCFPPRTSLRYWGTLFPLRWICTGVMLLSSLDNLWALSDRSDEWDLPVPAQVVETIGGVLMLMQCISIYLVLVVLSRKKEAWHWLPPPGVRPNAYDRYLI